MAAQEELKVEDNAGGKKKMIIIVAAVVVILAAVSGFLMMGGEEPSAEMSEELSLDEVPAAGTATTGGTTSSADMGTALYVAMPRPFVFNVPGASRDRLVQIKVQLLVRGAEREEMAKKHIPLIEGALLKVFSGANADDLATVAGKEALKIRALATVQEELNNIVGQKVVDNVLFTGFVMQ